jgi:hypothetical protein
MEVLKNVKGARITQSVQRQAMSWTAGFRFPAEARNFLLLRSAQTGSGAHPASYPMGIGGSFAVGKAAGV